MYVMKIKNRKLKFLKDKSDVTFEHEFSLKVLSEKNIINFYFNLGLLFIWWVSRLLYFFSALNIFKNFL